MLQSYFINSKQQSYSKLWVITQYSFEHRNELDSYPHSDGIPELNVDA